MAYLNGQTDDGVHGTVVVQVATGAVVARADGTDGLVCAVLVAVKDAPSCGGGQIRDGRG